MVNPLEVIDEARAIIGGAEGAERREIEKERYNTVILT